jgi:hypothetical protein
MEKRDGPAFPKWPVSESHADRLNGKVWAQAADLSIALFSATIALQLTSRTSPFRRDSL